MDELIFQRSLLDTELKVCPTVVARMQSHCSHCACDRKGNGREGHTACHGGEGGKPHSHPGVCNDALLPGAVITFYSHQVAGMDRHALEKELVKKEENLKEEGRKARSREAQTSSQQSSAR